MLSLCLCLRLSCELNYLIIVAVTALNIVIECVGIEVRDYAVSLPKRTGANRCLRGCDNCRVVLFVPFRPHAFIFFVDVTRAYNWSIRRRSGTCTRRFLFAVPPTIF